MNESTVISLVAPFKNCSADLEVFLAKVTEIISQNYRFYEVILIHHGPGDDRDKAVEQWLEVYPNIRYFALSGNTSKDIAILAGLDASIGDYVVILTPGFDPPELIPELLAKAKRFDAPLTGVVTPPPKENLVTGLLSRAFYRYCTKTLGLKTRRGTSDFQILNRRLVNALVQLKGRRRDLRFFLSSSSTDPQYFSYTPLVAPERFARPILSRLSTSIDLLFANSTHPLRAISWIGIFASGLCFLYATYVFLIYLFKEEVSPGWTTLSLVISCMFFFFFLIAAAFAEYLGRVFIEIQGRPLYYIAKEAESHTRLDLHVKKNIVHASE